MVSKRTLLIIVCLLFVSSGAQAAKNVILLIGDGMGLGQISCLMTHHKGMGKKPGAIETLLATAPSGLVKTGSLGFAVTDSAAAATAIACGKKTLSDVLGMDGRGRELDSTLDKAEKMGKWTGLISTHRLTDATPGAFYASVPTRDWHSQIAAQLLESGVEVALGGGLRYFIPAEETISSRFPFVKAWQPWNDKSGRRDSRDLLNEFSAAGYEIVHDRDSLLSCDTKSTDKLLGLFGPKDMAFDIDRQTDDTYQPSLQEMTDKALSLLSRSPKGFFLMVEGASIDTTAHHNDAGAMLGELKAFDKAVATCLDFAKKNKDTLVIVTADHGTGGPGFVYRVKWAGKQKRQFEGDFVWKEKYDYVSYPAAAELEKQRSSFMRMAIKSELQPSRLVEIVRNYTPFDFTLADAKKVLVAAPSKKGPKVEDEWFDFHPDPNHYRSGKLAGIFARQTGIVWATGTHTATPVPIMAVGPGSNAVRGLHDNTWIHHYIVHTMR